MEPYIPFNINPAGMQPVLTTNYLLAVPSILARSYWCKLKFSVYMCVFYAFFVLKPGELLLPLKILACFTSLNFYYLFIFINYITRFPSNSFFRPQIYFYFYFPFFFFLPWLKVYHGSNLIECSFAVSLVRLSGSMLRRYWILKLLLAQNLGCTTQYMHFSSSYSIFLTL